VTEPAWIDALGSGWSAHVPELALAAALAWGAGLRLYFVVFLFGIAAYFGYWALPAHLEFLAHPLVLAAAGFMMVVELFADKLPLLDTIWDAIHTFIRIPAGAALAAGVFGDSGVAVAAAAAILGGTLTATTHFSKAGARAATNTSPEPFSNLVLSTIEDVVVFVGSLIAINAPTVFLVLVAAFVVTALVLLRWLVRGGRRLMAGAAPPVGESSRTTKG
jgi:hypothetical protein